LTVCVDPADLIASSAAPPTLLSASNATTRDTIEIAVGTVGNQRFILPSPSSTAGDKNVLRCD